MTSEDSIVGSRLKLSLIKMADRDDVFATMNCEDTAMIISFMTWPMTMKQAENWARKAEEGAQNQTDLLYIARGRENGAPVGCIGLHRIKEENKNSAEVGYWLNPAFQGKGYAREMIEAMLDLAFNRLELDSVWATAIPTNVKSHKVLNRQGFQIVDKVVKPVAAPGKIAERNVYELKKTDYVAGI